MFNLDTWWPDLDDALYAGYTWFHKEKDREMIKIFHYH